MPATVEGDVDFVACMEEREAIGLREDKEWNEFVEFIG